MSATSGKISVAIGSFTSAIKALNQQAEAEGPTQEAMGEDRAGTRDGSQLREGGGELHEEVTSSTAACTASKELLLAQIYCNRSAAHAAHGAHTQVGGVATDM